MKTVIRFITFIGLVSVCFGFTLPKSVLVRLCQTAQSAERMGLDRERINQQIIQDVNRYLKKTNSRRYDDDDDDDSDDSSDSDTSSSTITIQATNNGVMQNVMNMDMNMVVSATAGMQGASSIQSLLNALSNFGLNKPNSGHARPPPSKLPTLPDNIFDGLKPSLANSSFPSFLPNEFFTKPSTESPPTESPSTESPATETYGVGSYETGSSETELPAIESPATESPSTEEMETSIESAPEATPETNLTPDTDYCTQIDYPEQLDFNNPSEVRKAFLRIMVSRLRLSEKQIKSFENIVRDYQAKLLD